MASEDRLISVKKLNEAKNRIIFLGRNSGKMHAMLDSIVQGLIDTAPAVDAVPVVRCKGCKKWIRNNGFAESPNGHCFCHDIDTNGYDFCSYGERKDNK